MRERLEAAKAQQMRQLIINSAVRLFDQYGYKNVRVGQITDEIGMTTGTFYYYFRNKEEILQSIYDYYISIAVDAIRQIYEDTDKSVHEKLKLMVDAHIKLISEYLPHVSVFFREYRNLSKEGLESIREKNSIFLSYVTKLIEQGMKERIFRRDLHPKIASLGIIGMCNWLYQWYNPLGEASADQIGDVFFKLISHGLYGSAESDHPSGNP